jgi:DNA-binding transcriptional LysR family regulator
MGVMSLTAGFAAVMLRLGLALIPALALDILHSGVAVRRLEPASQPVRHVLAVTRPAISATVPVQTMISALQAEAKSSHRGPSLADGSLMT